MPAVSAHDAESDLVDRAQKLIDQGRNDVGGSSSSTKGRRLHPENAQLAFLAAARSTSRSCGGPTGIKSFRDAIRLDPGYRSDPELAKIAARGFITTPDTNSQLAELPAQDDLGDVREAGARGCGEDASDARDQSAARHGRQRVHNLSDYR